ncbi:hypothetical protein OHQ88_34030 (plasmid) [Micromonospora zamorensis]|uniref:hypothetical protein n=1 Tax=Micromonospora zamorensis TaxID=709883 RepID=UPI002E1D9566
MLDVTTYQAIANDQTRTMLRSAAHGLVQPLLKELARLHVAEAGIRLRRYYPTAAKVQFTQPTSRAAALLEIRNSDNALVYAIDSWEKHGGEFLDSLEVEGQLTEALKWDPDVFGRPAGDVYTWTLAD